jgi:DNA-binding transcriptional regulator YiaG
MDIILENMTRDELRKLINESVKEILFEHLKEKPEQLLSRKEASFYLKVSLTTLKNWDESGYLKPKRYGRRVFYFESDLLERKT